MRCNNTQTQEQITDMKRSDFFIMVILFYSWVPHSHKGPQNSSKSIQIACYQGTQGCTTRSLPPGDLKGLGEESGRGQAAGHIQTA